MTYFSFSWRRHWDFQVGCEGTCHGHWNNRAEVRLFLDRVQHRMFTQRWLPHLQLQEAGTWWTRQLRARNCDGADRGKPGREAWVLVLYQSLEGHTMEIDGVLFIYMHNDLYVDVVGQVQKNDVKQNCMWKRHVPLWRTLSLSKYL